MDSAKPDTTCTTNSYVIHPLSQCRSLCREPCQRNCCTIFRQKDEIAAVARKTYTNWTEAYENVNKKHGHKAINTIDLTRYELQLPQRAHAMAAARKGQAQSEQSGIAAANPQHIPQGVPRAAWPRWACTGAEQSR